MSIAEENLNFRSTLDDSQFQAAIGRMEVNIGSMTDQITNQNGELETFAKKATDLTNKIFSLENMAEFGKAIVKVRAEYQQLELSFSTILKNKGTADDLMSDLISYTGATPFDLTESADAAKQLLSYGFAAKDVVGELKMLGEVAIGVSISVADLAKVYGNLKKQGSLSEIDISPLVSTGVPVYSALAEVLGIAKENVADFVSAGKVGFSEVEQAFKNMTSIGGVFSGLMEAQSKSWDGQIGTLKDAWDVMLNDMGKSQDSFFVSTISSLSYLVQNYQKVLDIIGSLIVGYGAYRAALILTAATTSILTYTTAGFTAAEILSYYWTQILTKAQKLLNATMLANPYAAVATALAAITTYLILTEDATLKVKTAAESTAEAVKMQGDSVSTAESKLRVYIEMLKNTNLSEGERLNIYNKIKDIDPSLVKGIDAKIISYENLKNGVDEYIKSLREKYRLETQEGAIKGSMQKETDLKQSIVDIGNEKDIWMRIGFPSAAHERERQNRINETRDILLKQQIETNKLIGNSVQTGTKEQIKAAENDLAIIESQKKFYKKGSVELLALQKQFLEKQEELNTLRNIKMGGVSTVKTPVIPKDKAFYEAIVKQNTDALDHLDKRAKDFEKKAVPLRRAVQGAQLELVSFSVVKPGKLDNDEKAALKRKADMLDKIFELNEKYNNKSLTGDEQKLQEIRNEFAALQRDIKTYNADPDNKKVNPNLKPELEKALENKQYELDTEKLSAQLDKQKILYDEYEVYKNRLGKAAADERFKNEIDTNVSLLQKLEADRALLLVKDPLKMTPQETDRLQVLDKHINLEVAAQQKKYDELIKGLISYEQERKVLTEKYNAEFSKIDGAGKAENQAILTKSYQKSLKALDDAHIKEFESYKKLYEGIDKLSNKNALTVIANAKTMLVQQILTGKISNELANEIGTLIGNAEKSVSEKLPGNITNLAGQITQLASSVGVVDSAFGKVLGTLGGVLSQVGNIKKGMNEFGDASKKGDVFGQIGAGLGIFGAGISIITSVAGLFDKSAQREAQASYARDIQIKQTEAVTKALDRQLQLINEVYGTEKLTKYAEGLATIQQRQKELTAQLSGKVQLTGDKELDRLITQWNDGEKKIHGPLKAMERFTKLKEGGGFNFVTGDLNTLRDLYENQKLDEKTAALVKGLLDLDQQFKNTFNADSAEKVGSSLDSIADGFINTLMDGTQDFGKSFEDVIQKSIINGFKGEIIRKELQEFYKQFAELADGGLTKEEIGKLRLSYLDAGEKFKKELEDLEKITGIDFNKGKTDGPPKSSGLTVSLTQDTGEKLEGLWRGQFDLTKQTNITAMQHLLIAKSNFDTGLKIEANTFRTANNTENLIRLVNIENTLISIDTKTSSKTTRD